MDLKNLIEDFSYLMGGEPSPEVNFHDGKCFEIKDGWGEKAVRIIRYFSEDIPETYFRIEYDRYKNDPAPVVVLTTLYDSVEFLYKVLRKVVERPIPWENRALRGMITKTLSRVLMELDKQLQANSPKVLLFCWEWTLSHMWTYRLTDEKEGRYSYGVAERRLAIFPGKTKKKVMELGWTVSPVTIELSENERGEDFSETASLLEFKGGSSDWQIWLPNKVHVFYDRMTLLQRRILEDQLFPKEEEVKEEVPVSKDTVEDNISAMEILKKNIEKISSEKVTSSMEFDNLYIKIKRKNSFYPSPEDINKMEINLSFKIEEGEIIYSISASVERLGIEQRELLSGVKVNTLKCSTSTLERKECLNEVIDILIELTSQIGVTRKEEVQKEIIKNILEAIPNVLLENKNLGGKENEK